ncbi:hypothetical protein CFP56_037352 [Quercus suber]
MALAQ